MTSIENGPPMLHDEHYRAFGGIVNSFARFEFVMIGMICKLLEIDFIHASMITAELPYRGKRDTLNAIIKMKRVPAEKVEKLNGYLGQLHQWNSLRNSIAHHAWKEGKRPDSIMPFGLSVRDGEANFIGYDEDDRDYTAKELVSIAIAINDLHARFVAFLRKADLLRVSDPENVEEELCDVCLAWHPVR